MLFTSEVACGKLPGGTTGRRPARWTHLGQGALSASGVMPGLTGAILRIMRVGGEVRHSWPKPLAAFLFDWRALFQREQD